MKEKAVIEFQGVDASYQGKTVLESVDFKVYPLDFVGIIGPNGGGKTTLLKLALGLLKPSRGHINYGIGKDEIGYLPQGIQVDDRFPISVNEVVSSGLAIGTGARKRLSGTQKARLKEVLDQSRLKELAHRAIGELSGGELQRAMLARAIISSPKLLVLDEPDTHVDNRFENELYTLLRELNKNITILLVSHDLGMISPYIKTIACVNRHLHYHDSNEITVEQLKVYNCPVEIISHGTVPHRVMKTHENGKGS